MAKRDADWYFLRLIERPRAPVRGYGRVVRQRGRFWAGRVVSRWSHFAPSARSGSGREANDV